MSRARWRAYFRARLPRPRLGQTATGINVGFRADTVGAHRMRRRRIDAVGGRAWAVTYNSQRRHGHGSRALSHGGNLRRSAFTCMTALTQPFDPPESNQAIMGRTPFDMDGKWRVMNSFWITADAT